MESQVTEVLAFSLREQESTLKAALAGIGTIVELKPATLALMESGLRVQKLLDEIAPDLEVAETLTIDSPDMLAEAEAIAGRLATVCADSGAIETERLAITSPFNDLAKKVKAGYDAPRDYVTGKLDALKHKILAYNAEQQRIAREQEAKDRQRREEEAQAAAAREAEATAAANKLLEQAKTAQANGSEITAAALVNEASTKIDAARADAAHAVTALHSRVSVAPVASARGVRENWTVTVTDLPTLILHVAKRIQEGDASLVPMLLANQAGLNAKAKLEKTGYNVPGTRADNGQSLSVRKVAVAA